MATGTLTFLFSDIEGSTRLLDELGSVRYTAVLERQAAILRRAFTNHGGREENTEGDSFFVIFDGAREALLAAIEGQRALAAEAWPDGVEVRVRMGLHAGEATTSEAGLVGHRHQPGRADRGRRARRPDRRVRGGALPGRPRTWVPRSRCVASATTGSRTCASRSPCARSSPTASVSSSHRSARWTSGRTTCRPSSPRSSGASGSSARPAPCCWRAAS